MPALCVFQKPGDMKIFLIHSCLSKVLLVFVVVVVFLFVVVVCVFVCCLIKGTETGEGRGKRGRRRGLLFREFRTMSRHTNSVSVKCVTKV